MLEYGLKLPRIQLRYRDQTPSSSDIDSDYVTTSSSSNSYWPLAHRIPPPTRFRNDFDYSTSPLTLSPPSTVTSDSHSPVSSSPRSSPPRPPRPSSPVLFPPPTPFKTVITPDETELIDRIGCRKLVPPASRSMMLATPGRDRATVQSPLFPPPANRVYRTPILPPINLSDLLVDIGNGAEEGQFGKYRRRRSTPLHFPFKNNRQPLSPRLVWYAHHGNVREEIRKEKQRQALNHPPLQLPPITPIKPKIPEFGEPGYDEEARQRRVLAAVLDLPKLPKFEKPAPFVGAAPAQDGMGDGMGNNPAVDPPRRKLLMTRLEKLASESGDHLMCQRSVPPHQLRRLGQEHGDGGGIQLASRLPRELLKAPMRFRPTFKKPVKPTLPPVQQVRKVTKAAKVNQGGPGGNGARPNPKKLPDHLLYGNFKSRNRNERPQPIILPPFRFSTKVDNKYNY